MNVQNLPRDDLVVKSGILPKLGALSFFDYANIEPRLFGYFAAKCGYPEVAKSVNEGVDPYTTVARAILDKDDISKTERTIWKRIFLAVLYGAGARRVRQVWLEETGKSISQAKGKQILNQVKDNLPGFIEVQDLVAQQVAMRATRTEAGYVYGLGGRRLHQEPYGEHKMVNKLIQGSAAELMKRAIVLTHRWLDENGQGGHYESHIISVVHDDLWIDGPVEELAGLNHYVPRLMTGIFPEVTEVLPIEVEHQVSVTNAAEKVPYDEYLAR